jgi:hypothetical protein
MKKILLLLFLASALNVHSQVDSLYYHNYNFESQYGASGAYPGPDYMQMLTRFTPVAYPAQLVGLRVWFRNAASPSPFKFIVRRDSLSTLDPNNTTSYYMSSSPITNPADNGIPDSAYSYYEDLTTQNLNFNSGDVYAGVTQNSQLNGFVGYALDTNNQFMNDRHWISTSQGISGSWFQFSNWAFIQAQFGITAYFHYVIDGVDKISSEVLPSIYPVPAHDYFRISDFPKENFFVSIFDLAGRLQKNLFNVTNKFFNVSDLQAGMYVVRIQLMNSTQCVYLELIKG